jgi:hypothetical protein
MIRTLPFLLLTIGCDEMFANDVRLMANCEDVESSITVDEQTGIDLTGSDLIDRLPESARGEVSWLDGHSGTLTWGFSADIETLRHVESSMAETMSADSDTPMIETADECIDYIAVDGTLTLQSDDGQLNEAIAVTMSLDEYSDDSNAIDFFATFDALSGDMDLSEHVDESSYGSVAFYLDGSISEGVLDGYLAAQGGGSSEDSMVTEIIHIATFSAGE